MARPLPFTLLLLSLMAAIALARPPPEQSRVGAALQLDHLQEASAPASSASKAAGAPESAPQNEHRRPTDKSIAGAEVMLGGLATAVFAAIFAYIWVTRKRSSESKA
ncbi:hypothetical protein ZIOFF_012156 [Zingiber officinale]|uniref:Uncharacterized protein n=1 Tax=Zingiber officinale TaxID=94328 RepID=A0A8J5M2Q8_ZINOF|nr:hypothetical protein ZIOFF_012156 [Zingiber officinale]